MAAVIARIMTEKAMSISSVPLPRRLPRFLPIHASLIIYINYLVAPVLTNGDGRRGGIPGKLFENHGVCRPALAIHTVHADAAARGHCFVRGSARVVRRTAEQDVVWVVVAHTMLALTQVHQRPLPGLEEQGHHDVALVVHQRVAIEVHAHKKTEADEHRHDGGGHQELDHGEAAPAAAPGPRATDA